MKEEYESWTRRKSGWKRTEEKAGFIVNIRNSRA